MQAVGQILAGKSEILLAGKLASRRTNFGGKFSRLATLANTTGTYL
jgi:hypothetical protein